MARPRLKKATASRQFSTPEIAISVTAVMPSPPVLHKYYSYIPSPPDSLSVGFFYVEGLGTGTSWTFNCKIWKRLSLPKIK